MPNLEALPLLVLATDLSGVIVGCRFVCSKPARRMGLLCCLCENSGSDLVDPHDGRDNDSPGWRGRTGGVLSRRQKGLIATCGSLPACRVSSQSCAGSRTPLQPL